MEKGKGNMASTAAQKAAASKSKQEVWEPLRKEGKGMDEASQVAEAEVAESDDGTDTDTDDDEGAVEAPCNNNLAAKLGNGGVILALVETKTGFAIFMYDGIKLLQEDALQNIWVAFSDHKLAERSVWLLEYRPFEPKVSAINSNGVSDELADMIIRRIEPGQKLAVETKGHVGPVTAMSFSENGYLLATAAHDGVRLWDVRKLTNLRTISPYDSGTATNTVEFDPSGSYLGIGGSDARIYKAHEAEWNIVKTLPDLSGMGKVTSLKFGAGAEYIAVGSMDCNLRIFGLPSPRR
nr:unnamed protein product [Digitaria exilis]CAB3469895.1 unnamed protein product [Digitaria exilis]